MRSWRGVVALMLGAVLAAGCASLNIPRIDPTGEQIFVDPASTACPPPTACPPQQVVVQPPATVPVIPRAGDDLEITLSPRLIVAPVGSEVVLLAGVRGSDNYLRTNQRVEWSLSPGGVGSFVAVGKNDLIDLLLFDFNRPRKVDSTFAVGSTSRSTFTLDRGTPTPSDDVCVLSGQAWITVTSPAEGTSHVVAYAPAVGPWDGRMRTATIHWIDAQWRFPPPAINPAGTRHVFTTVVTRHSNNCPCVGWLVRV